MRNEIVENELNKYKICIPKVYEKVENIIISKGDNWDHSMCPNIDNLTKLYMIEYIDSVNKASHGRVTTKSLIKDIKSIEKIKYNEEFIRRAKCIKDDENGRILLFRKLFFDKLSSEIEKMHLKKTDNQTEEFQKYMQKEFCYFSSRLAICYLSKEKQKVVECGEHIFLGSIIGKHRGYKKTLTDFLNSPNKLIDELAEVKVEDRNSIEFFSLINENTKKIKSTIDATFKSEEAKEIAEFFKYEYIRNNEKGNLDTFKVEFSDLNNEQLDIIKAIIKDKDENLNKSDKLIREINDFYLNKQRVRE